MTVPTYGADMTEDSSGRSSLNSTDHQIIELVAGGLTNLQIAEHLHLAHQTVRNRVSRLFDVLGVANRTQLAVLWLSIAGTLAVQPAEEHCDSARIVAESVAGAVHDPGLG